METRHPGMNFREFLEWLDRRGKLIHVRKPVSMRYEVAAILKSLDPKPVLFHNVKEYPGWRVAGNVVGDRSRMAKVLGVSEDRLLERMAEALEARGEIEYVDDPPCQEVVVEEPGLDKIPFVIFGERDGGPYMSASIAVAHDPEYGFNASYHRFMRIDGRRMVGRIVPRHLHLFIERGARDVAIVVGAPPSFLVAAAMSPELGVSELGIASWIDGVRYARTITHGLPVPAEAEVVIEGRFTEDFHEEGPFIDATGTYDIVRMERVVEVERITMRRNPIFHVILGAGSEHRTLMGTPKEASILREASKVCEVLDVRLTPGGCGWLHAVIKIRKRREDDGRRAIEAAFKAHRSLKHVVVVDEDIDINDPTMVEWAIATRVQLDRDLILKPGERGSSLDPSADQVSRLTCKAGLDATIPLGVDREKFIRARIPGEGEVRLGELTGGG